MKTNSYTNKSLESLYRQNSLDACRKALRITRNTPENERIDHINRLLGTYGVEAIRGDWQNGYWCDIVAVYCNTGDTYALTVMQVRGEWSGQSSRFIVTTVGDWVERNAKRFQLV